MSRLEKYPDEITFFSGKWSRRLQPGEAIVLSSWTVLAGEGVLIGDGLRAPSHDDTTVTVWPIGGAVDEVIVLLNEITTNASPPRVLHGVMRIKVKDPAKK